MARSTSSQAAPQKNSKVDQRPPFDCIALVLQGGGALGAYQCGVYEALSDANLAPDWVAGISIGAINAALIAGNSPETRVEKMLAFWEAITASPGWQWIDGFSSALLQGDIARQIFGQASAAGSMLSGAPGFFAPRLPPPWLQPAGSVAATSYYDTTPLKETLERFVDFDRINEGEMRFSIGAVNVASGNFTYFDSTTHTIRAEHVMASGALPPGFPAIEIDGEHFWDGGLVSNTPLQWVVDAYPRQDTLVFQVDLWSARGDVPGTLAQVLTRQKEILYSSRTREQTNRFKEYQHLCRALADVLDRMPAEMKNNPEVKCLTAAANRAVYNIVQLIYRAQNYEGESKDYEFSRLSMHDHWAAGYQDAVKTLRHKEIFERPATTEGVTTFDVTRDA